MSADAEDSSAAADAPLVGPPTWWIGGHDGLPLVHCLTLRSIGIGLPYGAGDTYRVEAHTSESPRCLLAPYKTADDAQKAMEMLVEDALTRCRRIDGARALWIGGHDGLPFISYAEFTGAGINKDKDKYVVRAGGLHHSGVNSTPYATPEKAAAAMGMLAVDLARAVRIE